MKPFSFCATFLVSAFATTVALAADVAVVSDAPAKISRSKSAKKKPAILPAPEKVSPLTEAASPMTPDTSPVPLETLPPPAPVPVPAPPRAVAPAPNPDRTETSARDSGSTRIEAVVGRTQTFGFAVGVRAGHRMANNVYFGGAAMAQTGVESRLLMYPAAELGYDAKLGDARFMPYLGIGPMIDIPTEGEAKVQVTPIVYPGFVFRYESDRTPLIGGADVRFLYLTEVDEAAVALNFTAGVRF